MGKNILYLPHDVLSSILRSCSLPTLCRFSSTCRQADILVAEEIARRHAAVLSKFVHDRDELSRVLDSTSSVISGSAALAVCAYPDHIIPADLDVCTAVGSGDVLAQYFISQEGYEIYERTQTPALPILSRPGISQIIRLYRDLCFVDILESTSTLCTFPIPQFWSTVPMLFLTGNAVHSLYPLLLEFDSAILNSSRQVESSLEAEDNLTDVDDYYSDDSDRDSITTIDPVQLLIDECNRWGIVIQDKSLQAQTALPASTCPGRDAPDCPLTVRYIGDRHTLQRVLGTITERRSTAITSTTDTVVWWLGGKPCDKTCAATDDYVAPGVRMEAVAFLDWSHAPIANSTS